MLTTEEEARDKLCPQCFHPGNEKMDQFCIGSACMAWRWSQRLTNVYKPVPDDKKTEVGADFTVHQDLGGYCGLAGMPIAADKAEPQ